MPPKSLLTSLLTLSLAATSTASTTASSKRGIPFNTNATLTPFENTPVSWCWNWASNTDWYGKSQGTGNLDYVPMLKGTDAEFTDGWADDAKGAVEGGARYLMAYNEPDINGIDPTLGASVYKTLMSDAFASQESVHLGAPALTNADSTFTWWHTFLTSCPTCRIDFWPIHWYDVVSNGAYFQSFINETAAFAAASGKGTKIWVTEIGFDGNPSQEEMTGFLNEQMKFLDEHPDVERYSFTAVTESGLGMLVGGAEGALSLTGEAYVAAV